MPLISIVIPSFNSAEVIATALTSVVEQDYADFEVLIMDGHSTDNTYDVVMHFQRSDKRIQWYSEPDNGIYDAMNKGIRLSKGNWIYFLGADDSLTDRGILNKVQAALKEKNPQLLYGNVLFQPQMLVYDGKFDFPKLLRKNICHQGIFYSRNLFEKIGDYNIKFRQHADWDLNLRIFQDRDTGIVFINEIIANFTTGSTSAAHDIVFLQESLIPLWIKNLESLNLKPDSIAKFDEWWRLIRNSELPWKKHALQEAFPDFVRLIISEQKNITKSRLKNGYFSKFAMLMAYLKYRIKS
jgi:glycosyltransferase involved in cell wall biosynthesis